MPSSPRRPAITIRTFSSAEYCRRVARRISRTAFSASSECRSTFDLISAPSALKMSQQPSLPQSFQTVQLVLTGNTLDLWRFDQRSSNATFSGQVDEPSASFHVVVSPDLVKGRKLNLR